MRTSVSSRRTGLSAHSHTRITFQPRSFQSASCRRSRRTLLAHFVVQNSTLDFGIELTAQPWRCQKQPRTSMNVWARGTTTSGWPG